MDISALTNISSDYILGQYEKNRILPVLQGEEKDFSSVLDTAMGMLRETNDYQNAAESAQIQFALGESVNSHELAAAQSKANITLLYTVSVRDKVLDAYKEIMNMQI